MDLTARYDEDWYSWTQQQAALLRRLAATRHDLPNDLDLEHVAEEIEDLGSSQVSAVQRHLVNMLVHVIKAVSSPQAYPVTKWLGEVAREQAEAASIYLPSMRRRLEEAVIWRRAVRQAGLDLRAYGEKLAALPTACPFALETLLDETRDPETYVAELAARVTPS